MPKESKDRKAIYWWLDDKVEQIILMPDNIRVIWKDGTETETVVDFRNRGRDTPRHVAERYKIFLAYDPDGKYMPGRTSRDKTLEIRELPTSRRNRYKKSEQDKSA